MDYIYSPETNAKKIYYPMKYLVLNKHIILYIYYVIT